MGCPSAGASGGGVAAGVAAAGDVAAAAFGEQLHKAVQFKSFQTGP